MPTMCYMCLDGLRNAEARGAPPSLDDLRLADPDFHYPDSSLSDYIPGPLCEFHRREGEQPGSGMEAAFRSAKLRTGMASSAA